jgi:tetratricopeptide (TPR) repeat protein
MTIFMLIAVVIGWLILRWRGKFRWHATPLDLAMLLWVIAFAVSLAANSESWRRIVMGLWFMGLYIGVWYALNDLLANDVLKRGKLVDAILLAGGLIVLFGFLQLRSWATSQLPLILSGAVDFQLPRPGSMFGNPNFLGSFLTVLIPLAVGRLVAQRRLIRAVMVAFVLVALLMLFLTFSRGAWLAVAVALPVQIALLWRGKFQPGQWWRAQSSTVRAGVGVLIVGVVVVAVIAGAFFVNSLTRAGRSTDLRLQIYTTAVDMFAEKPIAGHGLFTFGRGLARAQSMPPRTPHSHAHDIPLNVAAELGIVGLIALTVTVVLTLRMIRWNHMAATNRTDQIVLASGAAAVLAFGIHHILDLPAMMPAIALTGLVALVIAIHPLEMGEPWAAWRRLATSVSLAGLWIVLLATGVWSSIQYTAYNDAVLHAVGTGDFREAGNRLQTVIDSDPAMALYHYEQGFILGLAAAGDEAALRDAIAAFERYVESEPDYGTGWANLAALRWQAGDQDGAVNAMTAAGEHSPEHWAFAFALGEYREAIGNGDGARGAYALALEIEPDARLMPEWGRTELQRDLSPPLSEMGQAIQLLEAGEVEAAADRWAQSKFSREIQPMRYMLDEWIALARDDRETATTALEAADVIATSAVDRAWVALGRARLAEYDGESDAALSHFEAARAALELDPFGADYEMGINIAHIQFLRMTIPRQFVPQVYYPVAHPVLLYLLSEPQRTQRSQRDD